MFHLSTYLSLCQYHAVLSININPPNLLFFLKVILVFWGPLNVQINFRISLSISTKKLADALTGILLITKTNLKRIKILITLSSNL